MDVPTGPHPAGDHRGLRDRVLGDGRVRFADAGRFAGAGRIRVTIAAADPDAFGLLPASGKAAYRIGQGGTTQSYVELPVVR